MRLVQEPDAEVVPDDSSGVAVQDLGILGGLHSHIEDRLQVPT